jgi:hypothetical protein
VDWLFENPLPELLICGVLAGVFTVVALQKQRGVFLLGVLAFLLLGGLLWFLDRSRQTDRELVTEAVYDIVMDFQRNDMDGTLEHISPQSVELRNRAMAGIALIDIENARVTDVSVELSNQNSIAFSHFRVNATASTVWSGNVGHQATRWRARWQKSNQGWLMTDIVALDVVTGHEIGWPKPLDTE